MAAIHLIEHEGNLWKLSGTFDEWECGYWVVSEDTARKLQGGDLYLHSEQAAASHFGGTILGYRVQLDGEYQGRFIFRFRFSMTYRDVPAGRSGWGNEKKLVGINSAA